MPDWAALLSSCRAARERPTPPTVEEIRSSYLPHFASLDELLTRYASSEHCRDEEDDARKFSAEPETSTAGGASDEDDGDRDPEAMKQRKSAILNARRGLRFALACASLGSNRGSDDVGGEDRDEVLDEIQERAVIGCGMHKSLSHLISRAKADEKCRTMAARLLSNLVATNARTAAVVATDVALSPAGPAKFSGVLASVALDESSDKINSFAAQPNWVDMMSVSARAGNRESVAAVAAALYNCMTALERETNGSCGPTHVDVARSISEDRMIMCNLVRHILHVSVLKPAEGEVTPETRNKTEDNRSMGDDATEWISFILEKVSSLGFFPQMYLSLGKSTEASLESTRENIVTPEQVVLLHCIASAVENSAQPSKVHDSVIFDPLGGCGGKDDVIKTHVFLAQQVASIRQEIHLHDNSSMPRENYSGETECRLSVFFIILEMLATSFAGDDNKHHSWKNLCRSATAQSTGILSDSLMDLGTIVDRLAASNHGSKARELRMTEEDQRLVIVLVQLIGNLCYNCRHNQDMLRNVDIPVDGPKKDTQTRTKTKSEQPKELMQSSVPPLRTGLHILLSCTSFSYGCFTLREWAIVAIRNALKENARNQQIVAELEALQAVDTPELYKMGLKVDLDKQGKVQVKTEKHQPDIS